MYIYNYDGICISDAYIASKTAKMLVILYHNIPKQSTRQVAAVHRTIGRIQTRTAPWIGSIGERRTPFTCSKLSKKRGVRQPGKLEMMLINLLLGF